VESTWLIPAHSIDTEKFIVVKSLMNALIVEENLSRGMQTLFFIEANIIKLMLFTF